MNLNIFEKIPYALDIAKILKGDVNFDSPPKDTLVIRGITFKILPVTIKDQDEMLGYFMDLMNNIKNIYNLENMSPFIATFDKIKLNYLNYDANNDIVADKILKHYFVMYDNKYVSADTKGASEFIKSNLNNLLDYFGLISFYLYHVFFTFVDYKSS